MLFRRTLRLAMTVTVGQHGGSGAGRARSKAIPGLTTHKGMSMLISFRPPEAMRPLPQFSTLPSMMGSTSLGRLLYIGAIRKTVFC